MRIPRLRDKLLLSAVVISMVVALASMLAVSWVIRQQHLDQSNSLLRKASNVIEDNLEDRKNDLLIAARQLATQKNLGSTIWYLAQYAQANLDRETLFNTYQQLARDTFKVGRVANLSRIAIYDSAGKLISFALFDDGNEQVGFVERLHAPLFKVAALKNGEDLSRKNLRTTSSIANIGFEFGGQLPQQESVHYAVADGLLAIESHVPIMGEAFDPNTGKPEIRQLGLVAMVQPINQSFVEHISRLTDTRINVFTAQGSSNSGMDNYPHPDWSGVQARPNTKLTVSFNEVRIGGAGFYQGLIPLYTDNQLVGTITALHSKEIVRKNTVEMMQTLGLIALASLLLILPFAWYFATSISHPLTVLNRTFRDVASGTLHSDLDQLEKAKMRGDEFGELTQSFIAMDDAVNQKIRQINEINASLEHKVEERTAALAASEQESRTLIDNSPDTIARYDRECRRIYVNPAFGAMVDGGVAALVGKKPSEMPGGTNAEIYETNIKEVFATGENTQFELKWLDKTGREICSHIRLTAERDSSGNIISVLGVGRDITELNEYRSKLKLKGLAQTRFLAAAGHDLRQPIHAQGLFMEVLSRTELTRQQRELLASARAAGAASAEMLNTLLDFSRIEAGAVEPQIQAFRLQPLLNKIEREFGPQADAKGLTYHSRETGLAARSDPALIELILRNLVSNAIRYTERGGLLVACRKRGDQAVLEVWDTGIGIAPEHQQEVFREFHQLGNPERDRNKGLGMGLAIAEGLARTLGHELSLASTPQRGSVFRLSLPISAETPSIEEQDLTHANAPLHNVRVLVLDDDEIVRTGMSHLLRDWGCACDVAESIEEALAVARTHAPDLVISDYRLREQHTGLEAIAALRELLGDNLPALLITGDTAPERLRDAQASGIPMLHKPVSPSQLYRGLVTIREGVS